MLFKAITDFSGYTGAALGPAAMTVQEAFVLGAATFNNPPVTMPDFLLNIEAMDEALVKKASRARADYLAFNLSRAVVEENLSELGGYANSVAKGDESTLVASGFPFYPTTRTPDYSAPAAPTNVVIRQGSVSGSAVTRFRVSRRPSTNEVQTCTGDPSVEENWNTVGFFSNGKATINGITPGTTIWVRIRTIGLDGIMGAWSDPAKMMVI
jgi:hypothetical protein